LAGVKGQALADIVLGADDAAQEAPVWCWHELCAFDGASARGVTTIKPAILGLAAVGDLAGVLIEGGAGRDWRVLVFADGDVDAATALAQAGVTLLAEAHLGELAARVLIAEIRRDVVTTEIDIAEVEIFWVARGDPGAAAVGGDHLDELGDTGDGILRLFGLIAGCEAKEGETTEEVGPMRTRPKGLMTHGAFLQTGVI